MKAAGAKSGLKKKVKQCGKKLTEEKCEEMCKSGLKKKYLKCANRLQKWTWTEEESEEMSQFAFVLFFMTKQDTGSIELSDSVHSLGKIKVILAGRLGKIGGID